MEAEKKNIYFLTEGKKLCIGGGGGGGGGGHDG